MDKLLENIADHKIARLVEGKLSQKEQIEILGKISSPMELWILSKIYKENKKY